MKCKQCDNYILDEQWCALQEMDVKPSTRSCGEFVPITIVGAEDE
jgi:hypothetical protein